MLQLSELNDFASRKIPVIVEQYQNNWFDSLFESLGQNDWLVLFGMRRLLRGIVGVAASGLPDQQEASKRFKLPGADEANIDVLVSAVQPAVAATRPRLVIKENVPFEAIYGEVKMHLQNQDGILPSRNLLLRSLDYLMSVEMVRRVSGSADSLFVAIVVSLVVWEYWSGHEAGVFSATFNQWALGD